jgi:hypothetical protein
MSVAPGSSPQNPRSSTNGGMVNGDPWACPKCAWLRLWICSTISVGTSINCHSVQVLGSWSGWTGISMDVTPWRWPFSRNARSLLKVVVSLLLAAVGEGLLHFQHLISCLSSRALKFSHGFLGLDVVDLWRRWRRLRVLPGLTSYNTVALFPGFPWGSGVSNCFR